MYVQNRNCYANLNWLRKKLTILVFRFSFLRVPVNPEKVPDTTWTVEPGTKSLYLFRLEEASVTETWWEVFLCLFLDLVSTMAFKTSSGCNSVLRIPEIRAALFCSSSKAWSVFSCSSFACLKIASTSSSDNGLGLLICLFLQKWK